MAGVSREGSEVSDRICREQGVHMKPRSLIVVAFAVCLGITAISARADVESTKQDGNKLLNYCSQAVKDTEPGTAEEHFKIAWCLGYIYGFKDGFDGLALVSAKDDTDFTKLRHSYICFPEGSTIDQAIRVLVKFLKDHPERLHQPSFTLAEEAFAEAFPCQTRSPSMPVNPKVDKR